VANLGGAELAGVLTDTLVPDPGGPFLCGQRLCGQRLCGEPTVADDWIPLPIHLWGETVLVISGVTIRPVQLSLILTGGTVPLTLENILRPADSPPLKLLGGKVHVNPLLMPSICDDLVLVAVGCDDLVLVAAGCEPLELEESVCLEA